MAIFTMTESMVDGFNVLYERNPSLRTGRIVRGSPDDQPVDNPQVGDAISHHQIVQLWERLFRLHRSWDVTLESFMKGSEHLPPNQADPAEPTPEYLALMTRLRNESDQREYERLVSHRNITAGKPRLLAGSSVLLRSGNQDKGRPDSIAKYQKSLEVGGSFLFSIIGVPFSIFALARFFNNASLETSLILAAIAVPFTIVLELFLYTRHEQRMAATTVPSDAEEKPSGISAGGSVKIQDKTTPDLVELTTIPQTAPSVDEKLRRRHIPA